MDAKTVTAIGFYGSVGATVFGVGLASIQFRISNYSTDKRTKLFKNLQVAALILFVLSSFGTMISTFFGRSQTGKILAELDVAANRLVTISNQLHGATNELAKVSNELEEEKKKNVMAERLRSGHGFSGFVQIGKKGQFVAWDGRRSLIDVFVPDTGRFAKVKEENSVYISRSLNGDLTVSARICDQNRLGPVNTNATPPR